MFYGSRETDHQLRAQTHPIWFPASTSGDIQQPRILVSGDSTPSSGHMGHGYNVYIYKIFNWKLTFYKSLLLKIEMKLQKDLSRFVLTCGILCLYLYQLNQRVVDMPSHIYSLVWTQSPLITLEWYELES